LYVPARAAASAVVPTSVFSPTHRPLSAFRSPRYAVLRDLHSFPTRRSSDLGRGSRSRPRGCAPSRRRGRGRGGRFGVAGQPELGDRKSTRLNSSHVSISYAVFCLKKKKASTTYSTRRMKTTTRCTRPPTQHM